MRIALLLVSGVIVALALTGCTIASGALSPPGAPVATPISGTATVNLSARDVTRGRDYAFTGQTVILHDVTVPPGRAWRILIAPQAIAANLYSVLALEGYWVSANVDGADTLRLAPGRYDQMAINVVVHARALTSLQDVAPQVIVGYAITRERAR